LLAAFSQIYSENWEQKPEQKDLKTTTTKSFVFLFSKIVLKRNQLLCIETIEKISRGCLKLKDMKE
jgi:hypothetical protein